MNALLLVKVEQQFGEGLPSIVQKQAMKLLSDTTQGYLPVSGVVVVEQ